MPNPISIKTIANKGKVFDLTARTDVIALIGYVAPLTTKRALETRTPSCSKKNCSLISAPDSVSLTPELSRAAKSGVGLNELLGAYSGATVVAISAKADMSFA